MVDVRTLDNDQYAKYALLVMYAWDMCDADYNPASDALDTRIKADGWTVVGIVTGADDVIASGPQGIRQQIIRPSAEADRRRYGFLARNDADGSYVVAIRGTDGAEEWFDDFVFIAGARPPLPGMVETGFADIYFTMQYRAIGSNATQKLSQGVAAAVGAEGEVLVLGHSLGSTLATCLTYELADPEALGGRVGAVMFASPKVGDTAFTTGFAARVSNYVVINYEHDLVPQVPPFDITHLDLYRQLPYVNTITDETALARINEADKGCCHHLIDYAAMLSPPQYVRAKAAPGWTADDASCAACVLSTTGIV